MREPKVAIAGCGVICAVGSGLETLRQALRQNASGLAASAKFNSPRFQSNIVGAAPRDPEMDDPAWQLASTALKEAIAEAGTIIQSPKRTGLVLATTKANITALERLTAGQPCSETARRHLQANLLAEDLAREFGAQGPVQTVSVACVSGLAALWQAAKCIQRGAADVMLVVGVDCLSEFVVSGFTALKAIDPQGCRPFDAARCGLSPGEAGAAIVLARADLVEQPAITLRSFGSTNDANHLTGPSRDGSGLAQAIRAAMQTAQLTPSDIDYVHAHGTGTNYNDTMESLALKTIFGEACPPVSGSKGMLGHTLGAAGVIESIICTLALRDAFLPGTPGLTQPAEGVPASLLRESRPAAKLRHVLKLNTGFGGINGALILSHE